MQNKSYSKKLFGFLFVMLTLIVCTCIFASAETETESFSGYDKNTYEDVEFYVEGETSYDFTGKAVKPELSVYYYDGMRKVFLKENIDYKIELDDSVYPDSYSAYIESTYFCEYDFYCCFSYSIDFDSSQLHVDDIPSQIYTGERIKPEVNVYYGSVLLDEELYDVYYYNCQDAGTASVEIEFDYEFSYYVLRKSFSILPVDADEATVSPIPALTYSGYYQTPKLEIKYNGQTLSSYSDYSVTCRNNINAGTATAVIDFKGNFKGSKTVSFTINKLPASQITVEKISTCAYTGNAVTPYIEAHTADYYWLESGKDFTVKYSNNVKPGTATAKLKFKNNNISGTKTVSFKIAVSNLQYLEGESKANSVEIYWNYCSSVYKYKVYKYDSSKKEYVYIKAVKNCYYTDKDVSELTTYKYKVKPYVKIDGKAYNGKALTVSVKTPLFAPKTVKLTVKKGSITVSWSKCPKATGYYVMRYDYYKGKTKKVFTANKNTVLSYVDKSVKNYNPYEYYVVAYRTKDGKTTKSCNSTVEYSLSPESITRGVKLKPKTSYKVYDVQGSKTVCYQTINLSSNDIATLKKFASKHFTSKMTAYEKVEVTLNWIHSKVTYASAPENWNKICNKTFVDAIFNYKLGQCAQYNGALAGMMTYLGYDVQLIKGYRHYSNQHFWTECKINGLTYVMECGNKKDGGWHFFFAPYSQTTGYTKNGKLM